ncbi:hypothetical protein SFUMM280S_09559 [Streptomyces fumanus]
MMVIGSPTNSGAVKSLSSAAFCTASAPAVRIARYAQ